MCLLITVSSYMVADSCICNAQYICVAKYIIYVYMVSTKIYAYSYSYMY